MKEVSDCRAERTAVHNSSLGYQNTLGLGECWAGLRFEKDLKTRFENFNAIFQTDLKVNILHQTNEDDLSTPGPGMFFSPCYKPQLIQQNIRKGTILTKKNL